MYYIPANSNKYAADFDQPIMFIVIDLETLGKVAGSVVTEIGACSYVLASGHRQVYHEVVDLENSIDLCFSIDQSTVSWWNKQVGYETEDLLDLAPLLKQRWHNDVACPLDSLRDFNHWIETIKGFYKDHKVLFVGNGNDFDKVILEAYYDKLGVEQPWGYRDWFDLPTFVTMVQAITGRDVKEEMRVNREVSHRADRDAWDESLMIQHGLYLLKDAGIIKELPPQVD